MLKTSGWAGAVLLLMAAGAVALPSCYGDLVLDCSLTNWAYCINKFVNDSGDYYQCGPVLTPGLNASLECSQRAPCNDTGYTDKPPLWPTTTTSTPTTTLCVMRLTSGVEGVELCTNGACSGVQCVDGTRDYFMDWRYEGFKLMPSVSLPQLTWLFGFMVISAMLLLFYGVVSFVIASLLLSVWPSKD